MWLSGYLAKWSPYSSTYQLSQSRVVSRSAHVSALSFLLNIDAIDSVIIFVLVLSLASFLSSLFPLRLATSPFHSGKAARNKSGERNRTSCRRHGTCRIKTAGNACIRRPVGVGVATHLSGYARGGLTVTRRDACLHYRSSIEPLSPAYRTSTPFLGCFVFCLDFQYGGKFGGHN